MKWYSGEKNTLLEWNGTSDADYGQKFESTYSVIYCRKWLVLRCWQVLPLVKNLNLIIKSALELGKLYKPISIGNSQVCLMVTSCILQLDMSRLITKPTKWLCAHRRLRSAWAFAQSDQSPLSACRSLRSLATYWVHSKDSDQTGWMLRLIWVFAGCSHFVGFVMRQLIKLKQISKNKPIIHFPRRPFRRQSYPIICVKHHTLQYMQSSIKGTKYLVMFYRQHLLDFHHLTWNMWLYMSLRNFLKYTPKWVLKILLTTC